MKNFIKNSCVIYVRSVSKEGQRKSMKTQELVCKRFAEEKNLRVMKILRDVGASGMHIHREGLKRAIKYCKDNQSLINSLVVSKFDRLSGHAEEYNAVKEALKKYGVEIQSATENSNFRL